MYLGAGPVNRRSGSGSLKWTVPPVTAPIPLLSSDPNPPSTLSTGLLLGWQKHTHTHHTHAHTHAHAH